MCLLSIQRQSFLPLWDKSPFSLVFFPSPSSVHSCLCLLFPALCPSGANKSPLCREFALFLSHCARLLRGFWGLNSGPTQVRSISILLAEPSLSSPNISKSLSYVCSPREDMLIFKYSLFFSSVDQVFCFVLFLLALSNIKWLPWGTEGVEKALISLGKRKC